MLSICQLNVQEPRVLSVTCYVINLSTVSEHSINQKKVEIQNFKKAEVDG